MAPPVVRSCGVWVTGMECAARVCVYVCVCGCVCVLIYSCVDCVDAFVHISCTFMLRARAM